MSEFRPPRVPCLDPACGCCDEWVESHRALLTHYVAELDRSRALSDTLWQQVRRLVDDLRRRDALVESLQRQVLDEEVRRRG